MKVIRQHPQKHPTKQMRPDASQAPNPFLVDTMVKPEYLQTGQVTFTGMSESKLANPSLLICS